VSEVLGDHRLADAVGARQHHVGGLGEELHVEYVLHQIAVELARPAPVEVHHRFERPELGVADPSFQAPPATLFLLHLDQPR